MSDRFPRLAEVGNFKVGDRVHLMYGKPRAPHDLGEVMDAEPNSEGRIRVRWSSGVESLTKLDFLEPASPDSGGG